MGLPRALAPWLALLAAAVLGGSVHPAAGVTPLATEVALGVLGPFSGPAAPEAGDVRRALELVTDPGTALAGGIDRPPRGRPGLRGGARLRLAFADHQGQPAVGQAEAERLITREKAHALIVLGSSPIAVATAQVAERFGLPHVVADATALDLTQGGFRWTFRTAPHDAHLAQAVFDFLADLQGRPGRRLERVTVAHEDTARGTAAGALHRRLGQKYGYRVLADLAPSAVPASGAVPPPSGVRGPELRLLARARPAAPPGLDGARGLDWGAPVTLTWSPAPGGSGPEDPLGGAGLSPAAFSPERLEREPVARALNAAYRARTGKDLDELPALGLTALLALADAVDRAGSTDPAAIRAALVRTRIGAADLVVPWEGVRFDGHGQNVGARAIIVHVRGGRARTVWP